MDNFIISPDIRYLLQPPHSIELANVTYGRLLALKYTSRRARTIIKEKRALNIKICKSNMSFSSKLQITGLNERHIKRLSQTRCPESSSESDSVVVSSAVVNVFASNNMENVQPIPMSVTEICTDFSESDADIANVDTHVIPGIFESIVYPGESTAPTENIMLDFDVNGMAHSFEDNVIPGIYKNLQLQRQFRIEHNESSMSSHEIMPDSFLNMFKEFESNTFQQFFNLKTDGNNCMVDLRENEEQHFQTFVETLMTSNYHQRVKLLTSTDQPAISFKNMITKEKLTDEIDIDSFIFVAKEFPSFFKSSLHFYPWPNPRMGIHKTNHVSINVLSFGKLSLSQIPNVEIANFGSLNELRMVIFFPNLVKRVRSGHFYQNMVNKSVLKDFYDFVVRPMLLEVLDNTTGFSTFRSMIPISAEQYLQNARCDRTGHILKKTLKIPAELVIGLWQKIESKASTLANPQFRDLFYCFYSKGVKSSVCSAKMCEFQRRAILEHPNDCFVDVALTKVNVCDAFQKNSVFVTSGSIDKVVLNCKLKSVKSDTIANFKSLSGVRARTKEKIMETSHILYMQIYNIEKNLLYSTRKATNVTDFTFQNILTNDSRYNRKIMKIIEVLSTADDSIYGPRIEFRLSGKAFKYALDTDFLDILSFGKQLKYYSVPSYLFIAFKLIAVHTYHSMAMNLSRSAKVLPFNKKTVEDSIELLGLLIKGIQSRH